MAHPALRGLSQGSEEPEQGKGDAGIGEAFIGMYVRRQERQSGTFSFALSERKGDLRWYRGEICQQKMDFSGKRKERDKTKRMCMYKCIGVYMQKAWNEYIGRALQCGWDDFLITSRHCKLTRQRQRPRPRPWKCMARGRRRTQSRHWTGTRGVAWNGVWLCRCPSSLASSLLCWDTHVRTVALVGRGEFSQRSIPRVMPGHDDRRRSLTASIGSLRISSDPCPGPAVIVASAATVFS